MEDEFIKKLKEKYEKGEISEDTYRDILERYMGEYQRNVEKRELTDEESKTSSQEEGMSDRKRGIYKCAGSCILNPGTYEQIHVSGSLKIGGDIYAERIFVAGAMFSEGSIEAEQFKAAGSVGIKGSLRADRINVAGSFKGGNVEGDSLKMAGSIVFEKLQGDRVSLGGYIIAKVIKADELEMKLSRNCTVNTILGDKIEIESERGFLKKFKGSLRSNEIKGDDIYVESVTADIIEGDKVVIGDNCMVGIVKGSEIKVSKKSKVKKVIRND